MEKDKKSTKNMNNMKKCYYEHHAGFNKIRCLFYGDIRNKTSCIECNHHTPVKIGIVG